MEYVHVQALVAATLAANSFGGREAKADALVAKYREVLKELAEGGGPFVDSSQTGGVSFYDTQS